MKYWWESKTIWFNLLYLVVVIAGSFGYASYIPNEQDKQTLEAIAILINAVVNLWLRFKTDEPII